MRAVKLLSAVMVLTLTGLAAKAHDPATCADPLTVLDATTGDILRTFCREDLQELPQASFTTTTLWTDGPQSFDGVWLATLLDETGVSDGQITLRAINDYSVTASVDEFQTGGALVAHTRNGEAMSRRDKGPYWVVWNYDADAEFRTEHIYSLSIWQLDRIAVSR